MAQNDNITHHDAIIVGGGFAGCYWLHQLRDVLHLDVTLLEAADSLGGVWRWNCYPGARVDSEAPYYGFSDQDIWGGWTWKERYPGFQENREYFAHVDSVWGLGRSVRFGTQVTEVRWLEGERRWVVSTKEGRLFKCKWFLAGTGTSFRQYTPGWKGIDSFQGPIHHSSLWPEEGVDMKGKRVAVIGAGASGVQIVQEAAKVASHLTQFIRTPCYAVPMRQQQITSDDVQKMKSTDEVPETFKYARTTYGCLPFDLQQKSTWDASPEEREAVFEEGWKKGGFHFSVGGYNDFGFDEAANRVMYDFWCKKVRARISDPVKRDILAPIEPPYPFNTKRASLEQDYYELCDKDHVSLETAKILDIAEKGVVTEKGLEEFDVIAVATGYDAITGGLMTMGITNKEGKLLGEEWKSGIRTSFGNMIHGLPNFFMAYGPQAPTAYTNGVIYIEMQCQWAVDMIAKQMKEGIETVEPTAESDEAWRQHHLGIAKMCLHENVNSWYMGANVPGKLREQLVYLGGVPAWHKQCTEALENWDNFEVTRAGE